MSEKLSVNSHNSDEVGLKYVYPVISRRAGGLSIGINFNTNNACNWRCIYCQVPNLINGAAPDLDFQVLEVELRLFLEDVLKGNFYERAQLAESNRVIKDIAIAGNGEPTSLKEFAKAVSLIGSVATEMGIFPHSRFVLISNGSLMHQARVQTGLKVLKEYGGEVWFKLDSASDEGRKLINNAGQSLRSGLRNLQICADLCPTKLQICLLDYNKPDFFAKEQPAMLDLLKLISKSVRVSEVMLYTIARPSLQPEAQQLNKLSERAMNQFAEQVRLLGFTVSVAA